MITTDPATSPQFLLQYTPIRKNNRGICGFGHHMTAVTDILIFGLQLY